MFNYRSTTTKRVVQQKHQSIRLTYRFESYEIFGVIKFNAGDVENSEQFFFYDVPFKTAHHWCKGKAYKFDTAISGHKANTGFLRVTDNVQQAIIDTIFDGDINHLYEVMECDDDAGPGPAKVQNVKSFLYIFFKQCANRVGIFAEKNQND